jgi:predicted nuclease with TOPRIM domain
MSLVGSPHVLVEENNWLKREIQRLDSKNKTRKEEIRTLTKRVTDLREQVTYQNAEIQRLIERYERDTIPPGLKFKTGIDIRDEQEPFPPSSLIQGVDEVNKILGIKQ